MEKSLKDLISRLPIPGLKESTDRRIIADKITEILNVPIKANKIQFKDGIVTVSVPPVVKSALHIKKEILQSALQKEGITVQNFR